MTVKKSLEAMIRYLVRETRYTENELKSFSLRKIELMYKEEKRINKEM